MAKKKNSSASEHLGFEDFNLSKKLSELTNLQVMVFNITPPDLQSAQPSKKRSDKAPTNAPKEITPPFPLSVYAALPYISTRLMGSIKVNAVNTVGLGWQITPVDNDADVSLLKSAKKKVREFFDNCNDEVNFETLMTNVKKDDDALGNGYLEVVRDTKNKPSKLYHVPGHQVRILDGNLGYVQITDDSQYIYFKKYGDDRKLSSKNLAEIGDEGSDIKGSSNTKATYVPPREANEIIHFCDYFIGSSIYGIPKSVPASMAISGNFKLSVRNDAFFDNDAVPRLIITVSGGRLDTDSKKMIEEFLRRESKGQKNYGRVMVIQTAPPEKTATGLTLNEKIEITPLDSSEEASFLKFREMNDDEISVAFNLAKIFYGIATDVNRASALILRGIANEQVFAPQAKLYAHKIKHFILKEILTPKEFEAIEFSFVPPSTTTPLDDAQINTMYSRVGAFTANELRNIINKNFPEEVLEKLEISPDEMPDNLADIPLNLAIVFLQTLAKMASGLQNTGTVPADNTGNEDDSGEIPLPKLEDE